MVASFFCLSLMLGQSTRTDVRQAHERDLVNRYVNGLHELGGLDSVYDATMAWQDYERAMLYNWVYTGVVAGTLDVHNEKAFAWMSQMVARHSQATLDLGVLRLL